MAQTLEKFQSNFNGGIVSPFIEGRPDVAKFFNCIRQGDNVLILPEGGLTKRTGTEFIKSTKNDGPAILIAFKPNSAEHYQLEFGAFYVRVFRADKTSVFGMLTTQLITNGTFNADVSGWTDVSTGGGSISWDSATQRLKTNGTVVTSVAIARQPFTTVIGNQYTLTFDVFTQLILMKLGSVAGADDISVSQDYQPGTHTVLFTATSAVTWIEFIRGGTISAFLDNVSVLQSSTGLLEIETPYAAEELDLLQWRSSIDVLFLDHPNHQGRKLNRISDTNWTMTLQRYDPPPTTPMDTDISGGATLTPGATTGTGVNFHASIASTFLAGDIDRTIIFGASRAIITAFVDGDDVTTDIIDDFPDTAPIASGKWFLRGAPGATLDASRKEPVGKIINLVANINALRVADVGKYIKLLGGVVKITVFTNAQNIKGRILSVLSDSATPNPPVADEGTWTIEEPIWSDAQGWPVTNEFYQGRLAHGFSRGSPTTIAMSRTDDFENYAIGSLATDAVQYTHRSGSFDQGRWLLAMQNLFFGDSDSEQIMKGSGVDEPLGGDVVPFIVEQTNRGSDFIRPVKVGDSIIFVSKSRRKVYAMGYSFQEDKFKARDTLVFARTITDPENLEEEVIFPQQLKRHHIVFQQDPWQIIYFIRADGVILVFTFDDDHEIAGWSKWKTVGEIESISVIRNPSGDRDVLWMIVKRGTKRFVEIVNDEFFLPQSAKWQQLTTDSAIKIVKVNSAPQITLTGLTHLINAEKVDVLMHRTDLGVPQSPRYLGSFIVDGGGTITLNEAVDFPCIFQVGIPFAPTIQTLRPAIQGQMTEFVMRKWQRLFLRLYKSIPPKVNGEQMQLAASNDPMDQGPQLVTEDREVSSEQWDWDRDGYITITQEQPFPLTILCLGGQVLFTEM